MMTHHSNLSERDLELLSAFLDGELSDHERDAIEQRLAREGDLRRALDDLRATVRLVSTLPRLKAPRSFALDPAIYGARAPWWRRWLASGAALQWSGALGAAASVVLITLGLALSSGDSAPDHQVAAPAPIESAAPAAALLPTSQPSPSPLALFDAAPLAAGEAGAGADQTLDGEATEAILAAPEAVPPVPPGGAAAQPFAEAEAFAPPATLSPEAAQRFAAPMESVEAQAGAGAEAADRAGATSLTATPTPTATQPATPTAEQAAAVVEDEAVGAANASQKAQDETAREPGLRWWLVSVGAAGLALSAALFMRGRRRADA